MQRRTRLCVTVGREYLDADRLASLVDLGADAFLISLDSGDERWLPELVGRIRDAEHLCGRPLAVIVDLPESVEGSDPITRIIKSELLGNVDFLAVSGRRGSSEMDRLHEFLRDHQGDIHLIAKFDRAEDFQDVEGLVGSAHGVMITEAGLRSLTPSEAPIAQKTISRQCQVAAKPCLVARSVLKGTTIRQFKRTRRGV